MSRKAFRVKDMINNKAVANKPSESSGGKTWACQQLVRAAKQRTLRVKCKSICGVCHLKSQSVKKQQASS